MKTSFPPDPNPLPSLQKQRKLTCKNTTIPVAPGAGRGVRPTMIVQMRRAATMGLEYSVPISKPFYTKLHNHKKGLPSNFPFCSA